MVVKRHEKRLRSDGWTDARTRFATDPQLARCGMDIEDGNRGFERILMALQRNQSGNACVLRFRTQQSFGELLARRGNRLVPGRRRGRRLRGWWW
eukprot:1066232-Prymnesium_polylepis.2